MLDILCRLFSRNTQILAQSKRTDSIHNTEINRFCISSLQICHFIKRYMEYLGIKTFLDKCVSDAKEKGYAETLYGRRRPMPELKSSNFMQRSF